MAAGERELSAMGEREDTHTRVLSIQSHVVHGYVGEQQQPWPYMADHT